MVEQGDPAGIEFPIHELRTPAARRLADITGCLADLATAEAAATELLKLWPATATEGPDGIVPRSLWIAAVTSYARCFTGGVRSRVRRELVEPLAEGALETHDYFYGLRDKHVAHSVNAFEQTAVGVSLDPTTDYEPAGVASISMIRVLETREVTATFLTLVNLVQAELTRQYEDAKDEVLQEAHAMDRMDLRAKPTIRLVAPPEGTVTAARAR